MREKLNLSIPADLKGRLDRLCELSKSRDYSQLFQRALGVLDELLIHTVEEGGKVVLRKKDNKTEETLKISW